MDLRQRSGILNVLLKLVGLPAQPWLTDELWSKPSLIFMNLWGVGGAMLIYLAGLKGVPVELHEAARIDGANTWQGFWKITMPLLSPTILFQLVIGVIYEFQIFTQGYILGGGPNFSTTFYVLELFNNAFRYLKMGYASAMAWVLFAVTLVITLLVSVPPLTGFIMKRRDSDERPNECPDARPGNEAQPPPACALAALRGCHPALGDVFIPAVLDGQHLAEVDGTGLRLPAGVNP